MIHANRIVTVGDQESIIDRPIVLYRGDREVEIEFTLVGNEFTFSEEGNVIKSVNASHGQLVLNTPSGEHMFSELAECHEGKVIFVVTKEMIDEFIEMGFYSFQIRLYDSAEMKSRVTIPPVMNGFDIRNPIAAEDETNVVNQGIVDYARVFKDQSNEEVHTFDWTGAYNKTEWVHHDVITENKMNKIEDALYSINANIKESDVVMLNALDNVKKDADKYVKEHMAEVEDDVEEFERNLNTGVEKFKVDTNAAMTAHKNEVSEVVEEFERNLNTGVEKFKVDTNAAMTAHKNEVSEVVDGFGSQLAHIESKIDGVVNIKEYGCISSLDINIDNSEFLQNAIDSNINKKIYIPKGFFIIKDTINISSPIQIIGEGFNRSIIYIHPDFPKDKEIFNITPNYEGSESFVFEDISILPLSGSGGGDALKIINNSKVGTNDFFINRCRIDSINGYALNFVNSDDDLNPNGVPLLRITNNTLFGGIMVENMGDSCFIQGNNIKGGNTGIYVKSMVSDIYGWSSNLSILDNNINNNQGAIILENVRNFYIERNNIEQRERLEQGYCIAIKQLTDKSKELNNTQSVICKNKIEPASPNSRTGGVYLENARNVSLYGNYIASCAKLDENFAIEGETSCVRVKNSSNIHLYDNILYIDRGCTGLNISDSTKIIPTNITYNSFNLIEKTDIKSSNSFVYNYYNEVNLGEKFKHEIIPLTIGIDETNKVTLKGRLSLTSSSDYNLIQGDIIATIPNEYIPSHNNYHIGSYITTGGVYGTFYYRVMITGEIILNSSINNVSRLNFEHTYWSI